MTSPTMTLADLGWSQFFSSQLTPEDWQAARPVRVTAVHRSGLDVLGEDFFRRGVTYAPAAERDQLPTVGDWLLLADGELASRRLLARKSLFKRRAPGTARRVQLIAANVDTLFIATSCNEEFNLARLERFVALAREAAVTPVVVLTKADLADDPMTWVDAARDAMPDLLVEPMDARDPKATSVIEGWCGHGQTIALVGSSGVGKTTLINTLIGGGELATSGVCEGDAKGRHTTSGRAMHRLAAGGWVIDTPGMRELQLVDSEAGIAETFADIVGLAQQCRFADCSHAGEPGCAVQAALDDGSLDPARVQRFRKLALEEMRNNETLAQRRSRGRRFGKMIKSVTAGKRRERDD